MKEGCGGEVLSVGGGDVGDNDDGAKMSVVVVFVVVAALLIWTIVVFLIKLVVGDNRNSIIAVLVACSSCGNCLRWEFCLVKQYCSKEYIVSCCGSDRTLYPCLRPEPIIWCVVPVKHESKKEILREIDSIARVFFHVADWGIKTSICVHAFILWN